MEKKEVIKTKRKHRLLLIGGALLVLCAFIGTASAADIYVPDDHAKIQWAVDNATYGDTIIVRDRTYTENVAVNKSLTIRSENGSALTIVNASNPGDHVFNVSVDYVNISGFTVRDATGETKAGIYLGNGVDHCAISNNTASGNNDGICLWSSGNNTLTGNTANFNYVYGIYLTSSSNNTLTGNTASNNYAGIYLGSSSNNTLTSNTANSNNEIGISLDFSSSNTLTSNNTSNNHDGIYLSGSSDNTLTSNNASNNFYGISLSGSDNNALTNNTANSNNVVGIYLRGSSSNTLTSNTASNNSYGIHLFHSSSNTLTDNTANSNNYDGIYLGAGSDNNTLTSNNASNNFYGIYLYSYSNLIYNNYFNNTNNAYDDGSNIWNITKTEGTNIIGGLYFGGNYWSDYAGMDTDGDGLGDTSIPYNSSGNISNGGDYLPLTTRTPQTATTDIIDDVNALVDEGVLSQGQGIALIQKLEEAIAQMDRGNAKAASNLLQSFVNNVNSFVDEEILSLEQGKSLIDSANEIINALGGT